MELIQEISEYLQKGRAKNVKALVQQAIDEGIDPKVILNEGLLSGMMIIEENSKTMKFLFRKYWLQRVQ